ncbi:biotin-dependent carboxyltransferase family protein [Pseudomonas sp. BN414]|uniref:5-oxoprolinase subunit C family protein n=1 Tax=Pseudomonas sp. BN414 TaxID=2567888 RepID=UPI0024572837|nr:biotin-dependent carboxyltransferase family protein [Pseudomonas sp. BN414]MDH4567056.1 biotin-dependent carboxyltransferase family protein [Pseudomonas sp. BN414]
MIRILSSGALNLVQDLGRRHCLSQGVSRSGAMDGPALGMANRLVGNDDNAAGIEVSIFPFRISVDADTSIACTGCQAPLTLDGCPVPAWSRIEVKAGQVLMLERPLLGVRAYLAFAGGLDVAPVMGSRSTDLKGGFGGHEGRGLKRDDLLQVLPPAEAGGPIGIAPAERLAYWTSLAAGCVEVRVLPAAEHSQFNEAAHESFYGTDYKITAQANRVGYRLEGQPLEMVRAVELLSHGISPGTVQVPPAGQPIIQMAEANTCGGYPKIATVVEADLWRLAQAPSGCSVRFRQVEVDEALDLHRDQLASRAHLYERMQRAMAPAAGQR